MEILEIETAYPNVCAAYDQTFGSKSCCVGGAVCMFFAGWQTFLRFPPASEIANALIKLNPNLLKGRAYQHAREIVRLNDYVSRKRAWDEVKRAFAYGKEATVAAN